MYYINRNIHNINNINDDINENEYDNNEYKILYLMHYNNNHDYIWCITNIMNCEIKYCCAYCILNVNKYDIWYGLFK